ncbi:MAG: thiol reductant ABC exporter subunit CydC [Acidimicrobiales bacterium]
MTTLGAAATSEATAQARSGISDDPAVAPVARTLGIVRPAAGRLVLASLLGAGAVGAAIGLMGTSAWLISRAAQHPSESVLAVAIVGVQFFGLSRGFFRYGERLVGHDAAFRALADLRVRVYRSLEGLAPSGLPAFRSGDLLARVVADVDSLQDLMLRVMPPFVIAVTVGTATVALVWWLLPAAGLVLLASLLLAAILCPYLTGMLARRREALSAAARGELTASVVDLIDGASELIVYGATDAQLDRIGLADAELTSIAAASATTTGIGLGLTTLFAGLATWGGLVVGVPAVHAGHLDGVYLAVIALVPLAAFELVVNLPVATQALQRTRRAAARVFALTDAPVPVVDPAVPVSLLGSPYGLEARSVWAGYPGDRSPVLRGVDLTLDPGQRVAVIGASGAGKSSLAATLLRFLPYQSGSVWLEKTELDRLAGDDVRKVLGLVGQEAHMFDTTLAENLRIGKRSASDAALKEVLIRVGLADWLHDLPKGLETYVGRNGGRISSGQRQRVAVGRALLADFPVLVLDEPVEHLDPLAADAMTADLLTLTSGRSTVLITHRLAGLESVDEILVMAEGEVVERGTHDELLALGGRYCELWWDEMRTEREGMEADLRKNVPESVLDRGVASEGTIEA